MALAPIARVAIGAVAKKILSKAEQDAEAERGLSTFVSSSAIRQISWKDEQITVVFNRGGTYSYPGSRELYQDFVSAPSKGQYFNQYIRPTG